MALKGINMDATLKMVANYLDIRLLEEALTLIPCSVIWSKACKRLREEQLDTTKIVFDESVTLENNFLEEFISWFKNDFFSWFDTPYCSKCDKYDCEQVLNVPISPQPYIDNTEVFECRNCHSRFYFERYNDPYLLLKTRRGRCSEFTQVFTVMCFALGYEARYIYDTNDHAWTEVYSYLQGRWIHCDPSEGIIDKPLMYELGWGKKPTLILSFSPTMEIQDVTWRYSCDHKGVLSRRHQDTNDLLLSIFSRHNKHILDHCSPLKRQFLFMRLIRELAEFMTEPKPSEVYCGRTSGSLEWREQRGEMELPCLFPGYVFKLQKNEVQLKPKYYCMWYSANRDAYIFYSDKGDSYIKKGWKNCMYSYTNIIRKEELDWDQAYLAREKNGKPGKIIWKFDVTQTNFFITGLHVKTNAFYCDTGVVEVKAFNNRNEILFNNGIEFLCNTLHSEKSITVEVTLNGGRGPISWQQAQIARQSKDEGSSWKHIYPNKGAGWMTGSSDDLEHFDRLLEQARYYNTIPLQIYILDKYNKIHEVMKHVFSPSGLIKMLLRLANHEFIC